MVLGRSAKIIISLFVILVVLFLVVLGLSGLRFANEPNMDFRIVTTGSVYDAVKDLVGDDVGVKKLNLAGNEHIAEPTPRDIMDIEKSEVFVYSDEHEDEWAEGVIENIDTSKTKVIKISDDKPLSLEMLEEILK